MQVVVTGATGLIGRALLPALRARGHSVRVLSRPGWDGERDPAPAESVRGSSAVIHLAGENIAAKRWSAARKRHLRDSRIASAASLRSGFANAGERPKIFISASGVGYYGDRGAVELPETAPAGGDFLAELCRDWEAAALAVGAERTVMARFGVVLSREGGFLAQVRPMFRRFGAARLGSGRHWLSWIHIDDVVAALLLALEDERYRGPMNVVAPQPLTNFAMTEELKRLWGSFRGPPVPRLALRLMYGELTDALLGSQRARPAALERLGFEWKYPRFFEAARACL